MDETACQALGQQWILDYKCANDKAWEARPDGSAHSKPHYTPRRPASHLATVLRRSHEADQGAEEYLYDYYEALDEDQIGFDLADVEKDGRMRDVVGQGDRGSD